MVEEVSLALQLEVEEAHLAEVLVLGEEVVEDAQGGLQVKVDNVLRSSLVKITYLFTLFDLHSIHHIFFKFITSYKHI